MIDQLENKIAKMVRIEKFLTRYSVSFDYDKNLVEYVRTLDKRFWDKEPKKWFLPKKCNELGYTIDSIDPILLKIIQIDNSKMRKKNAKLSKLMKKKNFNLNFQLM